jgi:hypothetical protein
MSDGRRHQGEMIFFEHIHIEYIILSLNMPVLKGALPSDVMLYSMLVQTIQTTGGARAERSGISKRSNDFFNTQTY